MAKQLMMGNEAFAHAALEAGVRVVAGYPGTPSSEVIETIARLHAQGCAEGVHVEWSTNEKAALELLAGASYAGARTLFTCKQMGLNVASDALMSLNYVGVKGGMVLFVADDPGPISSQTEQDTRRYAAFAKVPVFDPENLEQGFDMMKAAFELSERYQTPVILRPTTRVCHASTYLEVADHTTARSAGEFVKDSRWVIFPKRSFEAHGEVNDRLVHIANDFSHKPLIAFNPMAETGVSIDPDDRASDARYGIIAGGVSSAYVKEALRMLSQACEDAGISFPAYRFMQVGTPYPFPDRAVRNFTTGLSEVIVLEELDHVIEDRLLALVGKSHVGFDVFGKLSGHTSTRGENSVDIIAAQLARFFGVHHKLQGFGLEDQVTLDPANTNEPPAPVIPARPPVLCPGCPHRGSFYAVKQALKREGCEGILSGDIGCYTLGNAAPLDAVDTCLCMGAGITMAQGLGITEPNKKQFAFVGDSTFFASAITGCINAVYNQHNITVVVLDNATTAMTGDQPHPGTGVTLIGPKSKPISIEAVLRAIGFGCVTKADPFDLEASIVAATEAMNWEGPSAVIYEQPCTKIVPPKPSVSIPADTCTGCKKCITEIGCPAIMFDEDQRVAYVDESLCTGCNLCVGICPFDVITPADPQAKDVQ